MDSSSQIWQEKPLGMPLPNSPHAVSVSMPKWQDVVDYEEGNPRVTAALQLGYPRFFLHPSVQKLFAACEARFAKTGECCFAFPSKRIAQACADYVQERAGKTVKLNDFGSHEVVAATCAQEAYDVAKSFWQHAGMVISSRLAEAVLAGESQVDAAQAKQAIRTQIARLTGETENQVSLYPCGMGAIYMAHQLVTHAKPGAKTIQLGFPYVDTLKLQEKCGFGAHFVRIEGDYLGEVATLLAREPIAAVFCEFPTNPLLRCVDMDALSTLLREHQVPLVVDDTVGSFANVDMRGRADLLVTSLTKFFSGVGDVMGGSLVLSSDSPFYSAFTQALSQAYEDVLWGEDAIVLADNAQDFEARMQRVNSNTETLCDYLRQQPQIQALYYPKYTDKALYDACKKPGGGYAGLFSIVFHNPAHAPLFYDALQVDKGPSLGTNFTLASPYTLLAHYNELDFAKASGVAPELVRVSVGIEATDDLLTRFKNALAALS